MLKFKERKICGDFLKFTLDKRSLHNRFFKMKDRIEFLEKNLERVNLWLQFAEAKCCGQAFL